MARNTQPGSYAGLMQLAQRCVNGATTVGAGIPLLINTAATIEADRAALLAAQATYLASSGTSRAVGDALKSARAEASAFCRSARNVLEHYLGRQHSAAWCPTGFARNLTIPQKESGLVALVAELQGYLIANPARENPALEVTALRAGTVLGNLNTARQNFDAQRSGSWASRVARDASERALRKRISGLVSELTQRIVPLDARWLEFGLNRPGAASVPKAPENVVALPTVPGEVQVSCDASANATGYRFYYQRPILDPEPIFAGSAGDPLFVIKDLTPGQSYLIYAAATNAGGESVLSEPASVVASIAAAA